MSIAAAAASLAFAQTRPNTGAARPQVTQPVHSPNERFDVYVNGKYVGSDPDLHIRMELQRDSGSTE